MPQNDEFLYNLRNANPIETVMGGYVNMIRRGRNYVCSCPFHSEKTPSCTVFTDTQNFYCFGCGAGGDVITFIMKIENLTFPEAVKLLAQRSGMEVPAFGNKDSGYAKRKTRIYEMNRIAANFYYTNLIKGADKTGLSYFANRKLTPQTIKKYGLGYASDSWNELTDVLRSKGYSDEEMADAWLAGHKNGRTFDMFRKRVMFPIVDLRGNIIGFGGRVLDDSQPKYLNTGKTPVFDKGSNLFSMNFAKNSNAKRLILCEGYMDVIAVNQAGFENVVATLGTAITPDQARLISHYAEEVIIAYDSDGAGQKATQKAINHFADVGLRTKILHMEGAKDPDEFIKKFGRDRFRLLIDGSNDANDFMLDKCEEGLDLSTDIGRVELLKRTAKVLAGIESPLEREVYISRTSKKCDIPVQVLKTHIDTMLRKNSRSAKNNEWRNIKAKTSYIRDDINPDAVSNKKEARAEETIISYLLNRPQEFEDIEKLAPPQTFVTAFNKKVYTALLDRLKNSEKFSLSLLSDEFSTDEMGRISGIAAKKRNVDITRDVVADCAKVLKNNKPAANGELSNDELLELFRSKNK
ncbi:DNA primase [Ruminococcus flavefaciens]|uniref:DNA primase n=1 Tax=Ruminococcus flavefaciens TaxID=1265 RepID=UPI0026EF46C5|nr:DNA primase [Ruminococcus flavefaciens]MDD7516258.1 DNA primase [Ruminococcus flavefaciens]MDY5692506.1 DNA primase [Ruminococcus flavefaciens]